MQAWCCIEWVAVKDNDGVGSCSLGCVAAVSCPLAVKMEKAKETYLFFRFDSRVVHRKRRLMRLPISHTLRTLNGEEEKQAGALTKLLSILNYFYSLSDRGAGIMNVNFRFGGVRAFRSNSPRCNQWNYGQHHGMEVCKQGGHR